MQCPLYVKLMFANSCFFSSTISFRISFLNSIEFGGDLLRELFKQFSFEARLSSHIEIALWLINACFASDLPFWIGERFPSGKP
jgi:hypothetical protein